MRDSLLLPQLSIFSTIKQLFSAHHFHHNTIPREISMFYYLALPLQLDSGTHRQGAHHYLKGEYSMEPKQCLNEETPQILDEIAVEELAIDGICGVY